MKRRQGVPEEARTAILEQEDAEAMQLFDRLMEADLDEVRRLVAEACSPWHVIRSGFRSIRTIRDTLVLVFEELHEVRRHREEITTYAHTDYLTGLSNRHGVAHQWERRHRNGLTGCYAFMLVDLDDFKSINDTHGHGAGDAVLKEVANRIGRIVRSEESITGRHGGDECIVILSGIEQEDALLIAERIRVAVAEHPIIIVTDPSFAVPMTLSIGVSVVGSGESFDDALRKADIALYQAKALGRNQVCMFAKSD